MAPPVAPEDSGWSLISKLLFGFVLVLLVAVMGYFLVYAWMYHDLAGVMSLKTLRGQVLVNDQADQMAQELRGMGYSFPAENMNPLHRPTDTVYRADVLNAFEPEELEDAELPEAYYIESEQGPLYVTRDEDGEVVVEQLRQ